MSVVEGAGLDHRPGLPEPIDWDDLRGEYGAATDYLVEPVLVRGRSHALYAPAKEGKSLLGLEMCVCLATGSGFLRQPTAEPVSVVYLDFEQIRPDIRGRLDAMGRLGNDLDRLHYYLLPSLAPLDTALGGTQIEALVERDRPELIVIDTTARVVSGAENDADTFRNLYRHTGTRLKAAGVTVLRLDHAGKDLGKGQRGTSAKNDDVDVVWQLTASADRLVLRCTHQRVGYLPERVDIVRRQSPLAHEIAAETWLPGTAALAEQLDSLEVPDDAGRPRVLAAIKAWNGQHPGDRIEATNRLIESAIRWRKRPLRRNAAEPDEAA